MDDEPRRSARWRRNVAAGFAASLALHAAALGLVHLDGGGPFADDALDERADERSRQWDRQAMRAVDVRISTPSPVRPPEPPAGPDAGADRPAGDDAGTAVAAVDAVHPGRTPGSVLAEEALSGTGRLVAAPGSGASGEERDGARRVRKATGQPASVRPAQPRERPSTFRPANDAARTAARSGDPPDLGPGAEVADDRGPGPFGPAAPRGGVTVRGGGSCGTPGAGGAIIDRVVPRGSLVGG